MSDTEPVVKLFGWAKRTSVESLYRQNVDKLTAIEQGCVDLLRTIVLLRNAKDDADKRAALADLKFEFNALKAGLADDAVLGKLERLFRRNGSEPT